MALADLNRPSADVFIRSSKEETRNVKERCMHLQAQLEEKGGPSGTITPAGDELWRDAGRCLNDYTWGHPSENSPEAPYAESDCSN
jgi:hypothetical protein